MNYIIIVIAITFCGLIWRFRFIDGLGAIFSSILFLGLFFIGRSYEIIMIMVVYAAVAWMSTYKKKQRKIIYNKIGQTDPQKGIYNVIGKVLLPVVTAVFSPIAFVAVLSYGIADSIGSQIGIHSSSKPILITSFRKVPAGTNGAISMLGTILGAVAGCLVGVGYSLIIGSTILWGFFFGLLGGLVGNFIDSFYGATIEARFNMSDWKVNLTAGATIIIIALLFEGLFSYIR